MNKVEEWGEYERVFLLYFIRNKYIENIESEIKMKKEHDVGSD